MISITKMKKMCRDNLSKNAFVISTDLVKNYKIKKGRIKNIIYFFLYNKYRLNKM